MEIKPIEDLKGDPTNPRIISEHDSSGLAESMKHWGDLSGIVFNIQTQELVGGHQRVELLNTVLTGAKKIIITERFDVPDQVGTVALGYVIYENRQFAYREVDWPVGEQRAANIAANRLQGEFKLDMLAKSNEEIAKLQNGADLLVRTGQTNKEIERLMKANGKVPDEPSSEEPKPEKSEKLEFLLTSEHRMIIEQAIENVKANRDLQAISSAGINGAALFVMASDYLAAHPAPPPQPGELTDIPVQ